LNIHISIKFNCVAEQLAVTQIRSKLDEHLEIFKNLRQDFSLALLVQIAGRDEEMAGDVKGLVQIGDEQSERKLVVPDVDA